MYTKIKLIRLKKKDRFNSDIYKNYKKTINEFNNAFINNLIDEELNKSFKNLTDEECEPMSNVNEKVDTSNGDLNSIISAEVTDTGINVFYHNKGEKKWLASFDYDSIGNAININCINPDKNEPNFKGTILMDDKAKKIYDYQKKLNDLKKKKRELNETLSTIDDQIINVMNSIDKIVSD